MIYQFWHTRGECIIKYEHIIKRNLNLWKTYQALIMDQARSCDKGFYASNVKIKHHGSNLGF